MLVIYGAGGCGREVLTAARLIRPIKLADDFPGSGVIGEAQIEDDDEIVIAISDSAARRKVASRFKRFGNVFAPTAIIGDDVEIGEGAIFCDYSMVTISARIGRHFHCNIYSSVAHDCVIGDYVTFGPRASCNGNVHIGDGAYVGAGAILKNGKPGKPLIIGAGAVIGCGAVVTQNVPDGATVVGNPARPFARPVAA